MMRCTNKPKQTETNQNNQNETNKQGMSFPPTQHTCVSCSDGGVLGHLEISLQCTQMLLTDVLPLFGCLFFDGFVQLLLCFGATKKLPEHTLSLQVQTREIRERDQRERETDGERERERHTHTHIHTHTSHTFERDCRKLSMTVGGVCRKKDANEEEENEEEEERSFTLPRKGCFWCRCSIRHRETSPSLRFVEFCPARRRFPRPLFATWCHQSSIAKKPRQRHKDKRTPHGSSMSSSSSTDGWVTIIPSIQWAIGIASRTRLSSGGQCSL